MASASATASSFRIKNVPVSVAAALMGKDPQYARIRLQRGLMTVHGEVIGHADKCGGRRYNYYISPPLFMYMTGATEEDIASETRRQGKGALPLCVRNMCGASCAS